MRAQRVQLKLYVEPGTLSDPERVVPVFHAWIREHALPETLVDVARYGHVHRGPAVILVGHASDYAIDLGEGRLGLCVTKKWRRDPGADLGELFASSFSAAAKLEDEPSLAGLRFQSDELRFVALDRLALPNTDQAFSALGDELASFASRFLGQVRLEREGGAREPLGVRLRRSTNERVAEIAKRLTQAS